MQSCEEQYKLLWISELAPDSLFLVYLLMAWLQLVVMSLLDRLLGMFLQSDSGTAVLYYFNALTNC